MSGVTPCHLNKWGDRWREGINLKGSLETWHTRTSRHIDEKRLNVQGLKTQHSQNHHFIALVVQFNELHPPPIAPPQFPLFGAPQMCVSHITMTSRASPFGGSGAMNIELDVQLCQVHSMWPSPEATVAQGLQVFMDTKIIFGLHRLAVMSQVFPHPPVSGQV